MGLIENLPSKCLVVNWASTGLSPAGLDLGRRDRRDQEDRKGKGREGRRRQGPETDFLIVLGVLS